MKLFRILTLIFINLYSFFTSASIETDSLNIYNDGGLIEKKKIYLNDEGLIEEKIFEYQNKSINDLKGLIKNWGGSNFRSFKDVLVNETDNQLVIRYIINDGKYLRVLMDLKDNKLRIRLYDDGLTHFNLFFNGMGLFGNKNKETCCSNGKGEIKKDQKEGMDYLISIYTPIISTSKSINEYILKNSDSKKSDNW
jgi:hypothetical protein